MYYIPYVNTIAGKVVLTSAHVNSSRHHLWKRHMWWLASLSLDIHRVVLRVEFDTGPTEPGKKTLNTRLSKSNTVTFSYVRTNFNKFNDLFKSSSIYTHLYNGSGQIISVNFHLHELIHNVHGKHSLTCKKQLHRLQTTVVKYL